MVGWHYRLEGLEFEQLRLLVMDREAWRAAVPEITQRYNIRDLGSSSVCEMPLVGNLLAICGKDGVPVLNSSPSPNLWSAL